MAKVYSFRVWDLSLGDYSYPKDKATLDGIKMARGEVVDGSEEMVADNQIDGQGRYRIENRSGAHQT